MKLPPTRIVWCCCTTQRLLTFRNPTSTAKTLSSSVSFVHAASWSVLPIGEYLAMNSWSLRPLTPPRAFTSFTSAVMICSSGPWSSRITPDFASATRSMYEKPILIVSAVTP